MSPKKHLISFIAITFSLSILLSLIVGLTGGHESRFIWLQFAVMPIPALNTCRMTRQIHHFAMSGSSLE